MSERTLGVMGRPVTSSRVKRLVDLRREQSQLRMWKLAPDVISYVVGVALGKEEADEGRLKAAAMILNRCLPTITAQAIQADTTSISASVDIRPQAIAALQQRIELLASLQEGNRKLLNGEDEVASEPLP